MIKIEYWNSYDILDIHYEHSYRNRFYLNVDVKKPAYVVVREATENSLGESVNTFLRWEKQYSFELYCNEPLADAISAITLHDNVWVTLSNGYSGKVKDFLSEIAWTEIDGLAKVNVTFVSNSYTVNGQSAAGCN